MRQLTVEIIQKCLNNCLHCSSWSNIKCENKIQTNKVFEIIDSASKLNIEEICLSGGEPFLHEGLDDIVKYINDKGIKVSIYTSGIVSEQGKITSISKERLSKINPFLRWRLLLIALYNIHYLCIKMRVTYYKWVTLIFCEFLQKFSSIICA